MCHEASTWCVKALKVNCISSNFFVFFFQFPRMMRTWRLEPFPNWPSYSVTMTKWCWARPVPSSINCPRRRPVATPLWTPPKQSPPSSRQRRAVWILRYRSRALERYTICPITDRGWRWYSNAAGYRLWSAYLGMVDVVFVLSILTCLRYSLREKYIFLSQQIVTKELFIVNLTFNFATMNSQL